MDLNFNMEVLIVDDSGFMRKLFRRNLIELGFLNIIEAVDGDDAIIKLKDGTIELIISDWNMPEKDGLSLLQWVRYEEGFTDIPFIMATAQGDKARVEEAVDNGANGHLTKPFTAAQLKEKIEIAFGLKEANIERKREVEKSGNKIKLKIAHIQITDHLVLGVLKHWIETGRVTPKYFELQTLCIPGWNPIQEALENGDIDGAFVLAPIAMDLFAYDVPIKLVSLAHKNGSIFVRSLHRELIEDGSLEDIFYNHVVQIPHKMSVHHMLAHKFLSEELGLSPGVPGAGEINVRFEVVPPVKMPQVMKDNAEVAGFIVAEPIGSKAIASGTAEMQCISSELWKDHPCCVSVFQNDIIQQYPEAVNEFVYLLNKAGKFIDSNKKEAAGIAVNFLDPQKNIGLSVSVLQKVLECPGGITMNDLYPVLSDLDEMQRYMHYNMGIGKLIDMQNFVDLSFADAAARAGV